MKRYIFLLINLLVGLQVLANEEGKMTFDGEVLNRHYWRGMQMGDSPAIETNACKVFFHSESTHVECIFYLWNRNK
ncbi:MAG: hypothetical protein ABFS16_07650 [Bacteroidota bacterium]